MSARTRRSRSNIFRASSSSNSIRKARWPSASARAARAFPGFYTKTGVGTLIAEGKEHKEFDGETYILERGLKADLSIVKAWKGDHEGNLIYRETARNFNPMMATAGKVTVAEVEELVPTGALDADCIHTPGIFVQRIVAGSALRKAHREENGEDLMAWTREDMAQRAAQGIARRLLRQSRHRYSDAGGELHSRRHGCDAAVGERHARHGPVPDGERSRRRSDQCRQADGHGAAQDVLFLLRRQLRDDPRRPYRSVDPGRDGSLRERRSRELDGAGQARQRHGRRDGSGGRRQALHRY